MRKIIDKNGNLKKNLAWAHLEVKQLEMIGIGFEFMDMNSLIARDGYFEKCGMAGAILYKASLNLTKFDDCMLHGTDFNGAEIKAGTFAACVISHTTFVYADLRATEFVECDICGADFRLANLSGARFQFRSDQALREFLNTSKFDGACMNGCTVNDTDIGTFLNKN